MLCSTMFMRVSCFGLVVTVSKWSDCSEDGYFAVKRLPPQIPSWRDCVCVCFIWFVRVTVCFSVALSLHFNGHFPGEPGLAGVYWSKGWWRWWCQLDYWSYKSCKAPAKSSPPTNQHPVFTGRMPFLSPSQQCQSTEGKISHSMDLLTPSSPGVFQLCLWPLIAAGYLGEGTQYYYSWLNVAYLCWKCH